MSLYDFQESKRIDAGRFPFYALIMAACRQADDINTAKLKQAWPDVWDEMFARYNAPGGYLPGENEAAW